MKQAIHRFHIPVMGLGYTIDSPVKVACYGISSVISIVEDSLIEKMRSHYYKEIGEEYIPITRDDRDYRAKRICDYLNLVHRIVHEKFETMKAGEFEPGSELTKYFELLADDHELKGRYLMLSETRDPKTRARIREKLLEGMRPGSIDVNIMASVDNEFYDKEGKLIENGSALVAALRGYALSNLKDSSLVLSAAMNMNLFNEISKYAVFTDLHNGSFDKKITLKVSDFRSATLQGKLMVKRGVWVSEFRVESGVNCGGHLFSSEGYLLGPIMEEFRNKREELRQELFTIYTNALASQGREVPAVCPGIRLTVQGGIGTFDEDRFLHDYYKVDSTGWGSPFLLVPEVTAVEEVTLQRLCAAGTGDIISSKVSPLGVRFSYLRGNSGETEKNERFLRGKPGSPCTEHLLAIDTEFTEKPICTASANYLRRKLPQVLGSGLDEKEIARQKENLLLKECLCVGLSNSALTKYKLGPVTGNTMGVTICPGPNIAYFNRVASLHEMAGHIYGRINLLDSTKYRPFFLVKELLLYIDYLKDKIEDYHRAPEKKALKSLFTFRSNLLEGIGYYRELPAQVLRMDEAAWQRMQKELKEAEDQISCLPGFPSL